MIYKRKLIDYFLINNHLVYLFACLLLINVSLSYQMSQDEMQELKEEVRELFYHGYDNYMKYAFPADELMPLSCKGRFRDSEPNRGDIDDVLGNFSLTLIDSMDTLVVMNNLSEFEKSVNNVIAHVQFDSDIVVSVFETNIRVVGGLLSSHVLANLVKSKYPEYLPNYDNQLLNLAKDCALRLLPAFDSTTGIPYPRVNLKYGMNSTKIQNVKDTCTACAGTMILEFGALSRMTNDTIFEQKARKAMDYLWKQRHRSSDLVGSVLSIETGDWIRRESGVGAGIDSYYEYLLKAYILLGDESYLRRFNRHYEGIMKYISQGPLLVDVHMHKPRLNAKNFMDSLLAFFPGLQVLKGDIIPAVETHEILFQVSKMHNYLLPEAFNINDFSPYWAQFLIRPEFIESTYFLYEATKDDHYLEVAKQLLKSIKKFTMTPCGFAAVRDVRTGLQDDRMDSFVLSETLKYLYLLFTNKEDLIIDLNQYIFTTEAHFLPLSLSSVQDKARFANGTLSSLHENPNNKEPKQNEEQITNSNKMRTCPNLNNLFKEQLERYNFLYFKNRSNKVTTTSTPPINYYEKVRNNLKNYVELSNYEKMKYNNFNINTFRDFNLNDHNSLPSQSATSTDQLDELELDLNRPIRLEPQDFTTTNPEHIKILKQMGINIIQLSEKDPVQLVHLMSTAETVEAGKEGIIFIKKMIKMSKKQSLSYGNFVSFVKFNLPFNEHLETQLPACSAQFGVPLNKDEEKLKFSAEVAFIRPRHACNSTEMFTNNVRGKFAIVDRGECMFINKVRKAQQLGAIGVIILDNAPDSSALTLPQFEMLGDDGQNDVKIPVVLLYTKEGRLLLDALEIDPNLIVHITNIVDETEEKPMIKLINSLKEARLLIDEQLDFKERVRRFNMQIKEFGDKEELDNQQSTVEMFTVQSTDQESISGKPEIVHHENNELSIDHIADDLESLRKLVKEKVSHVFDENQMRKSVSKLIDEYSKLRKLALTEEDNLLPNIVKNLEPSMKEFLETMKKLIKFDTFDKSDLPPTDQSIDSLLKELNLPDAILKQFMPFSNEASNRLTKSSSLKSRRATNRCTNHHLNATSFRDFISNDYWLCK